MYCVHIQEGLHIFQFKKASLKYTKVIIYEIAILVLTFNESINNSNRRHQKYPGNVYVIEKVRQMFEVSGHFQEYIRPVKEYMKNDQCE